MPLIIDLENPLVVAVRVGGKRTRTDQYKNTVRTGTYNVNKNTRNNIGQIY